MTHRHRRLRPLFVLLSLLVLLAAPVLASAHVTRGGHLRPSARPHARGAVAHRRSARVSHPRMRHFSEDADVPTIQVDGDTLSWNAVPDAGGYELVEKVPGQPDAYSQTDATSVTPAAVPGKMVWFSVRPASDENAWATETAIDYPATGSDEQAAEASQSIGQLPFQVGLVSNADVDTELPYLEALGAKTARLEFDIDTPVAQVVQTCREYARVGIKPLLLASFQGRLPTESEARSLGSWAAAVGPGGSAWNGDQAPHGDAVTDIEFGNETNDGYQFRDQSRVAFAYRAHTYALRARTAALAIRGADPGVGLLAIADTGEMGSVWISNMFRAVPDLGSLVAGWTVHPYGPRWAASIQSTISMTHAAGAPANVPIWVTEWGLSSDGGSCLAGGNYGFSACLTFSQAASTLQSTLGQMRTRFGSQIAAVYLFQASDQDTAGQTNSNQGYYGALQLDGAPKGAFTAAVQADLASS